MTEHANETIKVAGDVVSLITVLGALAQLLPAVAALLTIVWTCFRIYETKTVQGWLGKKTKE
jgi:hypothetical protein